MNTFLWILQVLLAIHTAIGAVWKVSTSAEQTMPSLGAIPSGVWLSMSVIELLCAVGLVLPLFRRSLGNLAPLAALVIAAEMLVFCVFHLVSWDGTFGPMVYWLIVAAVCGFIAYGRFTLQPLRSAEPTL